MPKTRQLTIGDKTYTIRAKASYKIMDWMTRQGRLLSRLDDGDAYDDALIRTQRELIMKMSIEPAFTMESFDDEDNIDEDDYQLGQQLMIDIANAMKDRVEQEQEEVKKKSDIISA